MNADSVGYPTQMVSPHPISRTYLRNWTGLILFSPGLDERLLRLLADAAWQACWKMFHHHYVHGLFECNTLSSSSGTSHQLLVGLGEFVLASINDIVMTSGRTIWKTLASLKEQLGWLNKGCQEMPDRHASLISPRTALHAWILPISQPYMMIFFCEKDVL